MKTLLPILLLLSGCITDSRINRQVAKATPERVLGLIQKNYPHLFTQRVDTLRDTLRIETVQLDTVVKLSEIRDTVTITKDRAVTKLWIRHDSIFVESKCLGDTLYIEKVVYKDLPKKDYYQWWRGGLNLGFTLLILMCLFFVIRLVYKKVTKVIEGQH